MNKDYKRWTERAKDGSPALISERIFYEIKKSQGEGKKHYFANDSDVLNIVTRYLAELEDKIENGTLVFKKEIPNKYYALVLHRDCYGKNSWHIHHAPIEYEKENNRVAIQVNGILYVTTKNMLFLTKPEAEAKLRELKGE